MKVRDVALLRQYAEDRRMSGARLSRHAGVSRQFIYMLLKGDKRSCTPHVAGLIEEALAVLPGTLFERKDSPNVRNSTIDNGRAISA